MIRTTFYLIKRSCITLPTEYLKESPCFTRKFAGMTGVSPLPIPYRCKRPKSLCVEVLGGGPNLGELLYLSPVTPFKVFGIYREAVHLSCILNSSKEVI